MMHQPHAVRAGAGLLAVGSTEPVQYQIASPTSSPASPTSTDLPQLYSTQLYSTQLMHFLRALLLIGPNECCTIIGRDTMYCVADVAVTCSHDQSSMSELNECTDLIIVTIEPGAVPNDNVASVVRFFLNPPSTLRYEPSIP